MENKLKLLHSIGKVYEESKNSKLEHSFFTKMDSELTLLSAYFCTTKSQALFVSMVFSLNYKGNTVDLNDLIDYFDCNPMKILEFNDDFVHLHSTGILAKQKSRHRMKLAGANDQFTIHEKISESILKNEAMPDIQNEKITDIFVLLERLYNIGEQRDEDEITSHELFSQAKALLHDNSNLPLIASLNVIKLDIKDTVLYLYLVWKTICGKESTDLGRALEGLFDNTTKRFNYMQSFLSGDNTLLKNNFVEIVEANFFNETEMKLTGYSCDLLKENEINLFANKKKKENILVSTEIPLRKLIFSEEEMKQLFLLKDLLNDTKFVETQKRLTEKNLPKGVTALLHGAPGTGKTEIVKQLAKETGRDIMKVEISKSKSMWFGESEKLIKKIFTDYASFAKECKSTPILLFNEADAIISKRGDVGKSGVAQTENAIQNILLEELENFEGILIATTNLASNLDTAFERRFLFKIEFQKPNTSIRAKIWKSKLPQLKVKDCGLLADRFNFSGGQIDNILRKAEIHEIVHDKKVNLENLIDFCSEETLTNHRAKIGFIKA